MVSIDQKQLNFAVDRIAEIPISDDAAQDKHANSVKPKIR